MNTLAGQAAVWMLFALAGYAVLGGADFGGGIWDLFAHEPRAQEQRKAVAQAMGPVWEANHVWLIFFFIIMFTAFPPAFHALSIAMFVPLNLVLAGIVLRGASFVLRSPATGSSLQKAFWDRVFGVSSFITALGFGAAVGAVSIGGIRLQAGVGELAGSRISVIDAVSAPVSATWLNPWALGVGLLALAMCAYLAAVYLVMETDGELQDDFRKRALYTGGFVAVWAALLLPLTAYSAPFFWQRFVEADMTAIVVGFFLITLAALYATWCRKHLAARILAALQMVTLLGSWASVQLPYLIAPDLTITQAASPASTLRFMLMVIPIGVLIVLPALGLLFWVFKRTEKPALPES